MVELSIIVAAYNVGRYLDSCLDSIAAQNRPSIEVLLIDDGSADQTGSICDRYAQKYSNFRAIHQQNSGVSVARNVGIEQASGEWVCFVDGDDLLTENSVAIMCDAIRTSEAQMILFDFSLLGETVDSTSENEIASPMLITSPKELLQYQISTINASERNKLPYAHAAYTSPWAKCFRKSFLMAHRLRFPVGVKKSQDQVFIFDCASHLSSLQLVPERVYLYRPNEGSVTRRYQPNIVDTLSAFMHALYRLCGSSSVPGIQDGYLDLSFTSIRVALELWIYHPQSTLSRAHRMDALASLCDLDWVKHAMNHYPPTFRADSWGLEFVRNAKASTLWKMDPFVRTDRFKKTLMSNDTFQTVYTALKNKIKGTSS